MYLIRLAFLTAGRNPLGLLITPKVPSSIQFLIKLSLLNSAKSLSTLFGLNVYLRDKLRRSNYKTSVTSGLKIPVSSSFNLPKVLRKRKRRLTGDCLGNARFVIAIHRDIIG